jgi:hypothetical protein
MDMSILSINLKTRKIQFTGAQQNLYIFDKGELKVVRGDSVYLFSDGFPDQFGGDNRKKYGYPRV